MDCSVKDIIRNRRSVRTYSGDPLGEEDYLKLERYLKTLKNPFGVPVEFRFLDAKQHGLSSPVVLGTDTYLAAKVPRMPNSEIAFGYEFEQVVLYAQSLGIGTVWIAGTLNRPAFEKAMEVKDTELMLAVTPLGYPAKKMSVREILMRKGVKADKRLPFETLFFKDSFSIPLTLNQAECFGEALEMVRLAPSAVNKQPWRAVVCGNTVHFYKKKAKAMSNDRAGDIQKVDIGIAMLHFALTMESEGARGKFLYNAPKLEQESDIEYIMSYVPD